MTGLDWIIVAFVTLLALYGYGQGFLVGAMSLVGFLGGAIAGGRLAPALLDEGARSPYAPLVVMVGALLGGGLLALTLESVAQKVRGAVRLPGFDAVDGVLGALLSAALGLGLAWVFGAVALNTPGARELRGSVQRSEVLSRLNDALPPSGPLLNTLARFDPFPQIDGPPVDVAPPRAAIARDPQVRAAAASVVRIRGTACGLGVTGSGWVARPGLVVTNAHVVAGQDDTIVQVGGEEPDLPARVVSFDERNDVAILRVEGLDAPALALADDPQSGTAGAILGYPLDGPYDVRAARVGATRTAISQDAYGNGPLERSLTSLRGVVRSGNSGGPVVGGDGEVLTTVFAATRGARQRGGYGVPNRIVRRRLEQAGGPVGSGPCAG